MVPGTRVTSAADSAERLLEEPGLQDRSQPGLRGPGAWDAPVSRLPGLLASCSVISSRGSISVAGAWRRNADRASEVSNQRKWGASP